MNGLKWQRSNRFRVVSLVGGSMLAMTVVFSGAANVQQVSAAPALFCAPADPDFGINADGDSQEHVNLMQPDANCQTSPPAPQANVAGSGSSETASDANHSNVYGQMMALAAQQTSAHDDNPWLAVYEAMAHDEAQ